MYKCVYTVHMSCIYMLYINMYVYACMYNVLIYVYTV